MFDIFFFIFEEITMKICRLNLWTIRRYAHNFTPLVENVYKRHPVEFKFTKIQKELFNKNLGLREAEEVEQVVESRSLVRQETIASNLNIFSIERHDDLNQIYKKESVLSFLQNRKNRENALDKWFVKLLDATIKIDLKLESLIEEKEVNGDNLQCLVEDSEFDFEHFYELVKSHHQDVDFEDLFSLILLYRFWPKRFADKNCNRTLQKNSFFLLNLGSLLQNISGDRIWNLADESDLKIRDPWRKIAIAKAWTFLKCRPQEHTIPSQDYVYFFVFRNCNRKTSRGNAFFVKFDPITFLDFVMILKHLRTIPEDFSKYYLLYKFYEFLDYFSMDEIGFICNTLEKHKIKFTDHPIFDRIVYKLWEKLGENIENVAKETFLNIETFATKPQFLNRKSFVTPFLNVEFQEKAVNNQKFDLEVYIQIMCMATEISAKLAKKVEDYLLGNENHNLPLKNFFRLQIIISNGVFPSHSPTDLNANLSKLLEMQDLDITIEKKFRLPFILRHFAYHGIHNEKLYQKLMDDERLFTKEKDGSYNLTKIVLYENIDKNTIEVRKSIRILHGLSQFNGYNYMKLNEKTLENAMFVVDCSTPTEASENSKFTDIWDRVGTQVPKMIGEIAGLKDPSRYLKETSILPFFGLTDIVYCLDANGNFVPLPDSYSKGMKRMDIKSIPNNFDHNTHQWYTLCLVSKDCHNLLFGALRDPAMPVFKITQDLGYKINLFNFYPHEEDDGDTAITEDLEKFLFKIIPAKKKVA